MTAFHDIKDECTCGCQEYTFGTLRLCLACDGYQPIGPSNDSNIEPLTEPAEVFATDLAEISVVAVQGCEELVAEESRILHAAGVVNEACKLIGRALEHSNRRADHEVALDIMDAKKILADLQDIRHSLTSAAIRHTRRAQQLWAAAFAQRGDALSIEVMQRIIL